MEWIRTSVILCWKDMLVLLQWDHISLAHWVIRLSTSALSLWLADLAAKNILENIRRVILNPLFQTTTLFSVSSNPFGGNKLPVNFLNEQASQYFKSYIDSRPINIANQKQWLLTQFCSFNKIYNNIREYIKYRVLKIYICDVKH